VFIFATIKDFGPLVSTTVAITRKLVNVGLSIVWGTDPVYWWHWLGVILVFAGVGMGALPGGHKQKGH
jgi:drug/metabolite transporter (DMT)-like permease